MAKNSVDQSSVAVRSMFNSIARRYDFLNHFLSFGIDYYWRKKTISLLRPHRPQRILDIATGTGDLAIAALELKPVEVIGIDFSEEMVKFGNEKLSRKSLNGLIKLQVGNAEALSFADGSFDAVTVAFGVRNFEHLEKGLEEIHRVLRPNGVVVILEFSLPRLFIIKQLYSLYLRTIVPLLGGAISRNRRAYEYLPNTVAQFPEREDFSAVLAKIGFRSVRAYPLTFQTVTIYLGSK